MVINREEEELLFLLIKMKQNIMREYRKVWHITKNLNEEKRISMTKLLLKDGFFAESFPVYDVDSKVLQITELPEGLGELSESFTFGFENSGVMKDGMVYTFKTMPKYDGEQIYTG